MTALALDAEPACPGAAEALPDTTDRALGTLRAERRPFADFSREDWDRIAARTPWATVFSSWAFHRAWWDAYAENAHEETLAVVPADAPPGADPVAIVPLMHRHEVEPSDALTHTRMRHGRDPALTSVPPTATAIFFGASYHADYATILAEPSDLSAVTAATAAYLAASDADDWDVVDLRRLRCADPAGD